MKFQSNGWYGFSLILVPHHLRVGGTCWHQSRRCESRMAPFWVDRGRSLEVASVLRNGVRRKLQHNTPRAHPIGNPQFAMKGIPTFFLLPVGKGNPQIVFSRCSSSVCWFTSLERWFQWFSAVSIASAMFSDLFFELRVWSFLSFDVLILRLEKKILPFYCVRAYWPKKIKAHQQTNGGWSPHQFVRSQESSNHWGVKFMKTHRQECWMSSFICVYYLFVGDN